jgi:nucleotide-binding universal stress UspA family protein
MTHEDPGPQPDRPPPQPGPRRDRTADPRRDRVPGPRRDRAADPRRDRVPGPRREPARVRDTSHPVVAGYDGSPSSRNALAYAAGMARRLGRPLLLVYVCPSIYCEPLTGQVVGATRDEEEIGRWLLSELDQVTDRDGLTVRVVTRRGSPARELAAAADESTADALVVGAPGHAWHHVAGSVPGWLARHAHCPVIVVP